MVKRTRKNTADKTNNLIDKEISIPKRQKSDLLSTPSYQSNENLQSDELIVSLSDAYENKRARQVVEWEKTRLQNLQRAA